jgi:hypothetical protein
MGINKERRPEMTNEIAQTAATIAAYLAPFTPYLIEGGKKFAGEAGEAAWENAQKVWGKIKSHFGDDKKIETAAKTVSTDPEDEDYQSLLAKALATKLNEDTKFTGELLTLIGGQEAVIKVKADKSSWIEAVTQEIEGTGGKQTVEASDDSVIKGVRQSIKK